MFDLKDKSRIICSECESELLVNTGKCPICGAELKSDGTEYMTNEERTVRKKLTVVYNMIFWAEEMDIETLETNEYISKAREQLDIGDLDQAEEYTKKALDIIFDPLMDGLKEEIDQASKGLRKAEISGKNVSELKDLIKQANDARKKGELDKCLILIKNYRKKIKEFRS